MSLFTVSHFNDHIVVLFLKSWMFFPTACNADLLWQDPAQTSVVTVTHAFWDYVAKATTTAEESLQQIKQSALGQEVE